MLSMNWTELSGLFTGASKKIVALSDESVTLILGASALYSNRAYWDKDGVPVSDADWDEIQQYIGEMEYEIMTGLIGQIIPNVMADYANLSILPCDGTTYLGTDYPLLFDAIDPVLKSGANFTVPDMRFRVPVGANVTHPVGEMDGEEEHAIIIDEMPIHAHGFTQYTFGIDIESVGVPDPTGVGHPRLPETTDNAGGGLPHNNLQPYYVCNFGIVYG